MISVLFVCLGNICRSPMAEAVFRHQVREAGLQDKIHIDSAGTSNWHIGEPPHQGTRQLLDDRHIDYRSITARQVRSNDLSDFDYVIAMDEDNLADLKRMAMGDQEHKLYLLLDFLAHRENKNVPDPYFTGDFDEVYDLISTSCSRLLSFIRERENI